MLTQPSGVLVIGTRALAQATAASCNRDGIPCHIYLTGPTGSFGARTLGASIHHAKESKNPCSIVREYAIDFVIPMSIDWHRQPWAQELIEMDTQIFSPHGDAILLERDRGFSMELARDHGCLLYTSPSPRDRQKSRMPSSA